MCLWLYNNEGNVYKIHIQIVENERATPDSFTAELEIHV